MLNIAPPRNAGIRYHAEIMSFTSQESAAGLPVRDGGISNLPFKIYFARGLPRYSSNGDQGLCSTGGFFDGVIG